MKILQIASVPTKRPDPFAGGYGGERTITLLCRGLQKRGHDVTLTCQSNDPLRAIAQEERICVLPFDPVRARTLPILWCLMRLARKSRAELLVSHDARSSRITSMVARLLRLPCVATMHGFYNPKSFCKAHRVIAVSHGVRDYIVEYGVPTSQVFTVYNSVDTARFAAPAHRGEAKIVVGLEPQHLIIGVVARLSWEKGHQWFLRAMVPLLREFEHLRVELVGDGPLRAELEALVTALGIGAQTRFVSYQADVLPYMSALDVLVLPSLKEGFGLVLAEAGAMGLPVVGTEVGGIGEVIVPAETGFLVASEDANALQNALRALIEDDSLRQRMGLAARARVEKNFSVGEMVAETEKVYRRLVDARVF